MTFQRITREGRGLNRTTPHRHEAVIYTNREVAIESHAHRR